MLMKMMRMRQLIRKLFSDSCSLIWSSNDLMKDVPVFFLISWEIRLLSRPQNLEKFECEQNASYDDLKDQVF